MGFAMSATATRRTIRPDQFDGKLLLWGRGLILAAIVVAFIPGLSLPRHLASAFTAACGTTTTGTVTATWAKTTNGEFGEESTDYARVKYADGRGGLHSYEGVVSNQHPVRKGDEVTVRYVPWAPDYAEALGTLEMGFIGWLGTSVLAIVWTGLPTTLAVLVWRAAIRDRARRMAAARREPGSASP